MTIAANVFQGLGGAAIFDRGRWFNPNFKGEVEVKKVLLKNTRAKGLAFIVELEVITSNLDEHPPGWKGSWFQKLIDPAIAFPAIRAWAAACSGYQAHQVKEIEAEEALRSPLLDEILNDATKSPDNNVFVGLRLILETTQVTTKNNTPFTRYDFSPKAA